MAAAMVVSPPTSPAKDGYLGGAPLPERCDAPEIKEAIEKQRRCNEIKAQVSQIMKRIDPVNLMATVHALTNDVKYNGAIIPKESDWEDLQFMVISIFEDVMNDEVDKDDNGTMHSRCGETYADIMFHLRMNFRQFEIENDKPMTFTRILLNVVQDEFENMTAMPDEDQEPAEKSDPHERNLKKKIALCSFIGHLHVRKLLAARVMAQVVHDLIGVRDRQPDKQLILCACELLHVIGKSIDSSKQGNMLMTQFLARLSNLAASKRRETQEAIYPQDIRNVIKGVHEARFHEWPVRSGSQIYLRLEVMELSDVPAMKQVLEKKMAGQSGQDVRPKLEGAENNVDANILLASHAKSDSAMKESREELDQEGDKGGTGDTEEDTVGIPFKVSTVMTGKECAIVEGLEQETLQEARVKECISKWTGIHPNRLVVLHEGRILAASAA